MNPVTAVTAVATATHFDRTTTLTAIEPLVARSTSMDTASAGTSFRADLDESWASLRGVHGGYQTALAVRAGEMSAPSRRVRTATTTFLRPAAVGPAELGVETLRSSRSFTTLVVTLTQSGRAVASTRLTMTADVVGRDWTEPVEDRPAPRAACVTFTPPPTIRHFGQAELVIDPSTVPVGDGSAARIAGHVRPHEQRPLDAAWIAMIGDWFPPSPFRRFAPPTGGVSIDYTVHLHALPDASESWLEGVFVARTSAGGIALERGTLALPGGALVAETFHTRWTG